jgi:hypothetical protein
MCKKTADCPKCTGSRKIQAFSHIESGRCFLCGGSGRIVIDTTFQHLSINDLTRKQLAWIVNATPEQWSRLTYRQVCKARDLAKSETGCRANVRWPDVAEDAFQARQAEMLHA